MASESRVSTDHEEIRQWAEERGAKPACVRGTGGKGDVGLLRLDFPGYTGEEKLEEISWEEFFEKFDERGLALLHRDDNFNKLVSRETAAEVESGRRGRKQSSRAPARGSRSRAGSAAKRAAKTVSTARPSATAKKMPAGRSAASTKRSAQSAAAKKGTTKKAAARNQSTGRTATRKKVAAAGSSRVGPAKKSTPKSVSKASARGKNTKASARGKRR